MRRLPSQHRWGRAGTARDVFVRRDYRILSETCQPENLLPDFPPAERRGSVVSDLPEKLDRFEVEKIVIGPLPSDFQEPSCRRQSWVAPRTLIRLGAGHAATMGSDRHPSMHAHTSQPRIIGGMSIG